MRQTFAVIYVCNSLVFLECSSLTVKPDLKKEKNALMNR